MGNGLLFTQIAVIGGISAFAGFTAAMDMGGSLPLALTLGAVMFLVGAGSVLIYEHEHVMWR